MASDSKRRIEVAAAELLARSGYHGFGLKALSEAAGLTYGSIYHHFPGGKEEIAVAAITGTGTLVGRMIQQAPEDVFKTSTSLFDFMATKLSSSQWTSGCPVGTPALDGGSEVDTVRAACALAFDSMENGFTALLEDLGIPGPDAEAIAVTVVAAYEGATLLARVRRSQAPLEVVSAQVARLIRSAIQDATARA
ncbi:TetR/AcrR family transcriptional repressor of lmrAB and yxaGH operons [Mycobacterium sp. MAA66]|uniref:TetR/AcrR family transcriptional regulator n=1 Tax=Mycobacterium sp. MAA66 TaxID=3156297 RepID=UPI0035118782